MQTPITDNRKRDVSPLVHNKWLLSICHLAVLLAATVASPSSAQFSLDWWTVDGGGGSSASTDGRFTLSGTAGQPDAGLMAGGALCLRGGFWNAALWPSPSLWITRLPDGNLEVSWPAWANDYLLEQAATLVRPPELEEWWNEVSPATYQTDGSRFYLTVTPTAAMQFYRLRQLCVGP
jgi:hypothetical protein